METEYLYSELEGLKAERDLLAHRLKQINDRIRAIKAVLTALSTPKRRLTKVAEYTVEVRP